MDSRGLQIDQTRERLSLELGLKPSTGLESFAISKGHRMITTGVNTAPQMKDNNITCSEVVRRYSNI